MVADNGDFTEDNLPLPGHPECAIIDPDFTSLKRHLSRLSHSGTLEDYRPPIQKNEQHGNGSHGGEHKHASLGPPAYRDLPQLPAAANVALAALSSLPTPLIVLSSLKTVVLANEAVGRLLGLKQNTDEVRKPEPVTDILRGQTLSQIGIDMISDGIPVWVSWEKFLDNLAYGAARDAGEEDEWAQTPTGGRSGESTPVGEHGALNPGTAISNRDRGRSPMRERTLMHDTVVDVVFSSQPLTHWNRSHSHKPHKQRSPGIQATCRMIISIWTLEDQRFFTLSFTSPPAQHAHKSHTHSHAHAHAHAHDHAHVVTRATSSVSVRSAHSRTSTSSSSSSVVTSPSEVAQNAAAFPPTGAPAKCAAPSEVTDFQKVTRMKDAMLNAMHIPVLAMWRDESVVFPNPAARRLLAVSADPTSEESYDFMSRFKPWTADFSRELEEGENPIISLCRTEEAFTRWQIGLINEKTGKRSIYDVSGHPVFDVKSGEFFAGLIAFKDVTEYTEKLAEQSAENEEQFKLILDMMPQMLWTTRPDGYHDYFSQRWYDYTGLTPANSLGLGWKLPFHEEDMPETSKRWARSLATGEEYLTEYRCRRYDGEWRWMLGRALPLRDGKTGKILKWFGTCTDIQEIVDARNTGERARQQLRDVLQHSQMNMWVIDREQRITFLEGSVIEGVTADKLKKEALGLPVYEVIRNHPDAKFFDAFKAAVTRILNKESELEVYENENKGRWFRSRLVPLRGKRGAYGIMDEGYIEGVIGISTEVTSLRLKEQENIKLLANESAAKEASKMKSNFLANMSHEIRTPIAGVLGMSELLMDTALDAEQSDFAQNIQRSANSLLTVINDILDFSKIESGRLDIEEVQFSLGIVLRDVAKMLSYAAQRKSLKFSSDLQLGNEGDLILIGDPGRIRQILTNLLTNSIKFTSEGYVKLTARIISQAPETTTVEFCVEDTGIGIEEEVKKRLFRPFSQADSSTARRFGGTGLGLTISKNLVDLMHGSISLESKLDAGTTAIFTIPFKKPEFIAGAATPLVEVGTMPDRLQSDLSLSCNTSSKDEGKLPRRTSPPVPSPKSTSSVKAHRASLPPVLVQDSGAHEIKRQDYHILVVEDNPVNQQIAIRFIRSLKFSVSAVWNGKEALEYLLRATSQSLSSDEAKVCQLPDLILMDVQMPVLDGYHATHMLRHHAPYSTIEAISRIPIVAMTASAIQGDREKCEKAGMDDYMAKPVKRLALEKMILKWIQGDRRSRQPPSGSPEPSKPSLMRSVTEHSSNCADAESIAANFDSRSVATAQHSTPTKMVSRPAPPREASAAEVRRPSLPESMLASSIAGDETEGDRAMRRAEAEDKARSLRDAKLLSATSEHGFSPNAPAQNTSFNEAIHLGGANGPMSVSYPNQGGSESAAGVMALTEENMEKLNNEHAEPDAAKAPSLRLADIPAPPPEINVDRLLPDIVALPVTTITPGEPSPVQGRMENGGLQVFGRRKSDWSTSTATAKPGSAR